MASIPHSADAIFRSYARLLHFIEPACQACMTPYGPTLVTPGKLASARIVVAAGRYAPHLMKRRRYRPPSPEVSETFKVSEAFIEDMMRSAEWFGRVFEARDLQRGEPFPDPDLGKYATV